MLPLIPESAPFSPQQRAWLNGFFAGVLNVGQSGGSPAPSNGHAATAVAAPPAEADDENPPWHDPALALDERLKLADGKPLNNRLMAAMAQLDCGACGYLCQTYSAAIARGEEKDLTRCSPGGSETAKALKRLLAIEAPASSQGSAVRSQESGKTTGSRNTRGKIRFQPGSPTLSSSHTRRLRRIRGTLKSTCSIRA